MLTGYLQDQAGKPFAWGRSDCVTFIADWIEVRTGTDAAANVRGRYDAATAERALTCFGGLARVVGRAMRRSGFRMTREPKAGDVAVVLFADVLACAIWTGRRWVYRSERGLILSTHGRLVAAWSL